jgi:hypothetical protein
VTTTPADLQSDGIGAQFDSGGAPQNAPQNYRPIGKRKEPDRGDPALSSTYVDRGDWTPIELFCDSCAEIKGMAGFLTWNPRPNPATAVQAQFARAGG